jgi:hypothetical protein
MAIVASGQMTLTDLNDSKQLVMYIGASQSRTVIFNGVSTYTPNYSTSNQVLTPQLFIAGNNADIASQAISTKWYVQTNGAGTPTEITANTTDYTLGTGTPKTLTIKTNVLASNASMTYICELVYPDSATGFNVTSKAEIEIVKVTNGTNGTNGQNATVAVLSNDADTVGADSAGNSQIITGVASTITVYEGTTDVTSSWSMGTPVVTGLGALNTAYTLTGTPVNRTFTLTGTNPMTADVATVTWTLTRSGYANITKVFTINRIRNGTAGTSPTLYRFLPSANAIKKTEGGVYSPASLVLEGKSQTGSGSYGSYAGRFKIYTTTATLNASTNWGTAVYTSSGNESTYTYPASGTFPANITGIKVELYLAGGTTTLLDSQVIPVVQDGASGTDAFYLNVWTPNGNTVKNGTGTVTATADLYKGAGEVSSGITYKWYIQDPTATTASGGDADSGDGWRLLTSSYNASITGYTTKSIVVPASAIAGSESFLCVASYSGGKYKNVCSAVDLSDPILVRIDGINVFKNGTGSTQLTATLLRNGEVLDPTGYTFAWSIYDENNVKTAFTASTQTVTVNASAVDGRANIVCEVSK